MDLNSARHAFVTGGASGIGLGIARSMVRRGIAVTIADINEDALAQACSEDAALSAVVLDTRDRDAWQTVKREVEAARGPVDVLVNNAGIAPNGRSFTDMDPESFDRILAINLVGIVNGVFAFAGDMKARGRGHIVNTSSLAGLTASVKGVGAYAVAKFGVTALTESLRLELQPHGVGVSLLCPGYVQTNLAENTVRAGGEIARYGAAMPPSTVTPDHVGEMVAAAIERDELYVITHGDAWPPIARRMDALREACEARALSSAP
ncbi:SDR family oxidoreductase [Novosphingobium sp. 9U]|uniref:SDR family oxidoreductase n=1 Tax=Novosphingobium sp. 9U TaxID=2653158 RepID=UPI0012F0EE71|nr:SDR family oxidoreductase [Novosphingobium sp. 9U]VWX53120.1 Alcohol dehydrogenase [Novosphingobium sp. 9U]